VTQRPKDIQEERRRAFKLLLEDLPTFAENCLKIRDKQGNIVPLVFNEAQRYIHRKLEEQKKTQGFVRAVVLKGRQQGMSTYTAARYFQQTLLGRGSTSFILSHETKSTAALFSMVKRFVDHLPPGMSPGLDTSNKNQLKFSGTESEYTVGTAGNEDIGRSMTIKYLHCSEVAFYARTDELETGLFQAVADMPGTEIILESTANGLGNMFHERAMKAQAGVSLEQLVFIPWYWQREYRLPPPAGFSPTEEESNLMQAYKLDLSQMYWRRMKIASTKGGLWKFQQEYPFTPEEAFLMSGETFYTKESLMAARRCTATSPNAPIIMGVDCARTNDRSVFTLRQGRAVIHYEVHKDLRAEGQAPTQQLISIAARLIDRYGVAKCFIDVGYGYGVIDGLHTLGYKKEVMGINFKQRPIDDVRFLNKRAEMHGLARDWVEEGETSIPDDDQFVFDLLLIPQEKETPTHRMFLPPKPEIKAKSKVSPDIDDSFVLTFAFPVAHNFREGGRQPRRARNVTQSKSSSALTTLNRLRQK